MSFEMEKPLEGTKEEVAQDVEKAVDNIQSPDKDTAPEAPEKATAEKPLEGTDEEVAQDVEKAVEELQK